MTVVQGWLHFIPCADISHEANLKCKINKKLSASIGGDWVEWLTWLFSDKTCMFAVMLI